MEILDTLVWLANVPVTNGYTMVFVAGFASIGLFALGVRGGRGRRALERVRAQQGLPDTSARHPFLDVVETARAWFFRVLALVVLAGGVLGILGLVGVPVTRGYIYDRGVSTVGVVDGGDVTYTTSDGRTLTRRSDFFTPSTFPDTHGWVSSSGEVEVRYLANHPQAFVIVVHDD